MLLHASHVSPTFRKYERLCSLKKIELLFASNFVQVQPFRLYYLTLPELNSIGHQVLISVPKRNFKKAVDRNLIKRQIRELYRTHKHLVYPSPVQDTFLALGFVYIGRGHTESNVLKKSFIDVIEKMKNKMG